MTAYKTIAQNLADTSARMEAAIVAAHDSTANALEVIDRLTKQNAVLKSENADLKARLAHPPNAVSVGGAIAVPSR